MGVLVRRWFHGKRQSNNDAKKSESEVKKPGPPPPPTPPSPPPPSSSSTMNNPPNPVGGGPFNTQPLTTPSSALPSTASQNPGLTEFSSSTFTTLPTPKDTSYTGTNALSTPAPIASQGWPSPTSTPGPDGAKGVRPPPPPPNHAPMYAAAAIIPVVVVLAIIGIFLFVRKRKRRNQKTTTAVQTQEMKTRQSQRESAYVAPLVAPLIAHEASYTRPPHHSSPPNPPPVILGPISAGANGNYFTGIDTSDMVSVRSNGRTGLGDPFVEGNSLIEEPPPPYQPRSFAPWSRDTSLRSVSSASSRTHLVRGRGSPPQSPSEDSRSDDETLSQVDDPTTRNRDDISAMSDLSYQHDPFADSRRA